VTGDQWTMVGELTARRWQLTIHRPPTTNYRPPFTDWCITRSRFP